MAKDYRPVDRNQPFLLPPSMIDWLPDDHLVWFMIEAVDRLDTRAFHTRARLGGVGRQGYNPDMLLTLWMYAMAHGERSSRKIERLCHTDVAFRIICASHGPDHTVLARFRQDHEQALTDLLTQTLLLCAQLGMVRLGVIAFDGTKIAANAAMDANRTEQHLRKLAYAQLAEAAATDAAEDDLFGEHVRGDELPEKLRDRTHRGRRIAEALAQVQARQAATARRAEKQQAAAADYVAGLSDPAPGRKPPGRTPAGVDPVEVARARWQRERARAQQRYDQWQAQAQRAGAEGRKLPGRRPVPVDEHNRVARTRAALDAAIAAQANSAVADQPVPAQATETAQANLTDPDSRTLKTRNGWVQGYNCQTSISDDELILTARATQDANDLAQFQPTMTEVSQIAEQLATHTGRDDLTVGTMIGDAGYDSADNLNAEGPDRLIPDSTRHQTNKHAAANPTTGQPPEHASAREKMNHRLRTPHGHALYKRRAPMIEAPNAWLKDRRGLRHFSRRGLPAVQSELSLACAVTNILKIFTTGITAAILRTM